MVFKLKMSTFLHRKPFYFLTDRETKYTQLITPTHSYAYYPDSLEALSAQSVASRKSLLAVRFLAWALTHPKAMLPNDYRASVSRLIDMAGMVFLAFVGARVLKRFAGRIDLPFLENTLKDRLITLDTVKSFTINLSMGVVAFRYCQGLVREDYLYDLALEYRSNYDTANKFASSNCWPQLSALEAQRFGHALKP